MKHHHVPRFTHTFVIYEAARCPNIPRQAVRRRPAAEPRRAERRAARRLLVQDQGHRPRRHHAPTPGSAPSISRSGPDGAIYVADLYDGQIAHLRHHEGKIDTTNGRIYRLRAKDAEPCARPFDLGKLADAGAGRALLTPEPLVRAGRPCACSATARTHRSCPLLLEAARARRHGQLALEALWALNLCGGLDDDAAAGGAGPRRPVRAALDGPAARRPASSVRRRWPSGWRELAATEPNVEVRSQLACSARRLPAGAACRSSASCWRTTRTRTTSTSRCCSGGPSRPRAESDREARAGAVRPKPAVWGCRWSGEARSCERLMRRYAQAGGADRICSPVPRCCGRPRTRNTRRG